MTARITFSLGGSGGLGKSSGARAVAQALAQTGMKVALVDANPGQQSQRAFLGVPPDRGLEDARFADDIMDVLVMPGQIRADYAFLPGPMDTRATHLVDRYGSALIQLARICDIVVVDADRTDRRLWNDPNTISGGLIRPFVDGGRARVLFRLGQTGSQLHDGLAALDAIHRPEQVMAIAQTPIGIRPRKPNEWRAMLDGLAEYGGCDQWTEQSTEMVDSGLSGPPHGQESRWLANAAVWAGGRPDDFRQERTKWIFGRRRG